MASNSIPAELDWVTARSECSLHKMFKELKIGVTEDVNRRNAARKEGERVRFQVLPMPGGFSAFREDSKGGTSIDFTLSNNLITVTDGESMNFTVSITLNNEGRCKFLVAGKELEQWQVRRMALEQFFVFLG